MSARRRLGKALSVIGPGVLGLLAGVGGHMLAARAQRNLVPYTSFVTQQQLRDTQRRMYQGLLDQREATNRFLTDEFGPHLERQLNKHIQREFARGRPHKR